MLGFLAVYDRYCKNIIPRLPLCIISCSCTYVLFFLVIYITFVLLPCRGGQDSSCCGGVVKNGDLWWSGGALEWTSFLLELGVVKLPALEKKGWTIVGATSIEEG